MRISRAAWRTTDCVIASSEWRSTVPDMEPMARSGRRILGLRFWRLPTSRAPQLYSARRRRQRRAATMAQCARVSGSLLRAGCRLLPLPLFNVVPPKQIAFVKTMLSRAIQTVDTSSCGRLFDAVASILGFAMRRRTKARLLSSSRPRRRMTKSHTHSNLLATKSFKSTCETRFAR